MMSVIVLSVIMLIIILLSVIMLNVVMLSVVAPFTTSYRLDTYQYASRRLGFKG
jgi:hypothetical protein